MIIYDKIDDETRFDMNVFDLIFKLEATSHIVKWSVYLFIMIMMEKSHNVCQKSFKDFVYFYTINHDDINDEFNQITYGFFTIKSFNDDINIKTIKSILDQKMLFFRKLFTNMNVNEKYEIDVLWEHLIDHDITTKIIFDREDYIPPDIIDSYLYGVLKKTIPNVSDDLSLLGRSLFVLNDIKMVTDKYIDNPFMKIFYDFLMGQYMFYCVMYHGFTSDFIKKIYHQNGYISYSIEQNNGIMSMIMELYHLKSQLLHFITRKDESITRLICTNGHIICDYINFFEMSEHYDMKISKIMQKEDICRCLSQINGDFSLHMKNDCLYNNEIFNDIKQKISQMIHNSEILKYQNELQLLIIITNLHLDFKLIFNIFMSIVDYIKIIYIRRIINSLTACSTFYGSISKWYKKVFRIIKYVDMDYILIKKLTMSVDSNEINDWCDPMKNKFIHLSFEYSVFLYCYLQEIVRDFLHIHNEKIHDIYKHINLESFRNDEPRRMVYYDRIEQLKAKILIHMKNVSNINEQNVQKLEYMTVKKLENGDFDNYVFFSKKKNCDLISQKLNNRKRNKYLRKKL